VLDLASMRAHRAAILEFLASQAHPYSACKAGGQTFFVYAGPPGPSPYLLASDGQVLPSLACRYAPANVTTVFSASGAPTTRVLSGVVELDSDADLRVLLAFRMSETLTEEGVRLLADKAKHDSEQGVMNKLASSGFLY